MKSRVRRRCSKLNRWRVLAAGVALSGYVALALACARALPASALGSALGFAIGVLLVPPVYSPWEWAMHRYFYHRKLARALEPIFRIHHWDHHARLYPARRFLSEQPLEDPEAHPSVWRAVVRGLVGLDLPIGDKATYLGVGALVATGAYLASHSPGLIVGFLSTLLFISRIFGQVHAGIHAPGAAPWVERRWWFGFLARHHYLHHVDSSCNANFILPLADLLFGTLRTSLSERELERYGTYPAR